MFGQPKRNQRCLLCGAKGSCSCTRRINAELQRNPAAVPTTCTAMCGWKGKGKACGQTTRGGKCPCPNC